MKRLKKAAQAFGLGLLVTVTFTAYLVATSHTGGQMLGALVVGFLCVLLSLAFSILVYLRSVPEVQGPGFDAHYPQVAQFRRRAYPTKR